MPSASRKEAGSGRLVGAEVLVRSHAAPSTIHMMQDRSGVLVIELHEDPERNDMDFTIPE
jgi:hypothetical protein